MKKQYANSPIENIPFPLWEPPPIGMKQLSTLSKPSFRVNMTKASCVQLMQAVVVDRVGRY